MYANSKPATPWGFERGSCSLRVRREVELLGGPSQQDGAGRSEAPSSHRVRAICLDLDGTLIDPYLGISRSIAFAIDRLGRSEIDVTDCRAFIGPPIQETFRALLGHDDAAVTSAVQYFRERYAERGIFEARPYPDIPAVLADLSAKASLFVCTSKPRLYADRIMRAFALDRYFSGIYGSELDGTHTRKSELLAWLLKREGLSEGSVAMVGDRSLDISAAQENGLPGFGVLWGYGSEQELTDAGAIRLFSEVHQLRSLPSIIA